MTLTVDIILAEFCLIMTNSDILSDFFFLFCFVFYQQEEISSNCWDLLKVQFFWSLQDCDRDRGLGSLAVVSGVSCPAAQWDLSSQAGIEPRPLRCKADA